MHQFAGVLFHVDFMNADGFRARRRHDIDMAVAADRQIQLADLVRFGQIGVEIVFAVKFIVARNLAVRRQTRRNGTFLFATGSVPGMPVQTGQVCVLGAPPNLVVQPQKIFVLVASSTCTSRPITISYVAMTQSSFGRLRWNAVCT